MKIWLRVRAVQTVEDATTPHQVVKVTCWDERDGLAHDQKNSVASERQSTENLTMYYGGDREGFSFHYTGGVHHKPGDWICLDFSPVEYQSR